MDILKQIEKQDLGPHMIGWLYASGLFLLHNHMFLGVSEFFMSLFIAGIWAALLVVLLLLIQPLVIPLMLLCMLSMSVQVVIQKIWQRVTNAG